MDNRATILSCALDLFASRGYDAVGVQEIAEAAGVTKPTLYHYFGSKHGLLVALLDEQFGPLLAAVAEAADYHHDIRGTIERVARTYFDYASSHRTFYRMQLAFWFAPPQSEAFRAVQPWNERQHRLLEVLFEQAARDHGNMRGRQRPYAATLLGMINTYAGLAINDYAVLGDDLRRQAVHQFMHGIFS